MAELPELWQGSTLVEDPTIRQPINDRLNASRRWRPVQMVQSRAFRRDETYARRS